jgi:hypothetical protein
MTQQPQRDWLKRKGGVSIVVTPQGSFYTPEAVERLLASQKEELVREIEGMRKESHIVPTSPVHRIGYDVSVEYNQAISDILALINKEV